MSTMDLDVRGIALVILVSKDSTLIVNDGYVLLDDYFAAVAVIIGFNFSICSSLFLIALTSYVIYHEGLINFIYEIRGHIGTFRLEIWRFLQWEQFLCIFFYYVALFVYKS